jgi:hypothetical protein
MITNITAPSGHLRSVELALVVRFVGPSFRVQAMRAEIMVLGGKKHGMRLSTWVSNLQKVEK